MSAEASQPHERPDTRPPARPAGRGLCPRCEHVRVITSERGSSFWLCSLSAEERSWPKYPPQPVLACSGFRG